MTNERAQKIRRETEKKEGGQSSNRHKKVIMNCLEMICIREHQAEADE